MKYFIANWKANKNYGEITKWFDVFTTLIDSDPVVLKKLQENTVTVVVCPPHPFLAHAKRLTDSRTYLAIGAQDVSQFEEGSYTGEVTAKMLSGLASYVIIGHSERRTHFHESDTHLEPKITLARQNGMHPILCLTSEQDKVFEQAEFVAYDPPSAIGTGQNESLENVLAFKKSLNLPSLTQFLYGGSVTVENVGMYLASVDIHGFLVGGASLDPHDFFQLLTKV